MLASVLTFLQRMLMIGLIGLIALGPFLHGHLGASHETGFHVDGLHAVHAALTHIADPVALDEDESPGFGVDPSLRPIDLPTLWALAPLLLVLLPVLRRRLIRCLLPAQWAPLRITPPYAPGQPPPVLAPPAL